MYEVVFAILIYMADSVCITGRHEALLSTLSIPTCSERIANKINKLESIGVARNRTNVAGFTKPTVDVACVFHDMEPDYVISTPVFIGEEHVSDMMAGILHKTTGVWAWDIVLDAPADKSRDVILSVLFNFALDFRENRYCESACNPSHLHSLTKCSSLSFPSHIRIIDSSWPLWETRADNTVFSDRLNSKAKYVISVQADQLVMEVGWNIFLSLPAAVWPDVISVSTNCAENLQCMTSGRPPMYDQIGSACNTNGLPRLLLDPGTFRRIRLGGRAAEAFHIRDSSTRGPILFHLPKVQQLGFFDEVNYLLGNDDHDIHMRAFDLFGYVTGFYPIWWTNLRRNRTAEFLLKKRYLSHNEEARVRKEKTMLSFLALRKGGRAGAALMDNRTMSSHDNCLLPEKAIEGRRTLRILSTFKIQSFLRSCGKLLEHVVGKYCNCSSSKRAVLAVTRY